MQIALTNPQAANRRKWLKRAGMAGFWFFFVKGLLWLATPVIFYYAL